MIIERIKQVFKKWYYEELTVSQKFFIWWFMIMVIPFIVSMYWVQFSYMADRGQELQRMYGAKEHDVQITFDDYYADVDIVSILESATVVDSSVVSQEFGAGYRVLMPEDMQLYTSSVLDEGWKYGLHSLRYYLGMHAIASIALYNPEHKLYVEGYLQMTEARQRQLSFIDQWVPRTPYFSPDLRTVRFEYLTEYATPSIDDHMVAFLLGVAVTAIVGKVFQFLLYLVLLVHRLYKYVRHSQMFS